MALKDFKIRNGIIAGADSSITGTLTATTFSGSGASLTNIPESAITDGSLLARLGANETVSGTWTFSNTISGNINTATTLATSRAINGVNFNGSAAITVPVNNTDDISSSGTVYPLWTTAAGGNYAAKVSTTKLSFVPSTGTLTTTTFVGALTGNATTASSVVNALTIGSGLSGTSFNGSSAVTIAINSTVALRADTHYVGTTSVALNRASANLALTGISSVTLPGATSGTVQIIPTAVAGTGTVFTLPAVTGTAITTGDTGTVTNTMLAGSIATTKLANSTITIGSTVVGLGNSTTTISGLTSVTSTTFVGALTGNASTATTLATARTINGVSFDGSANITIPASISTLTIGSGLSGTSFNGSAAVTIAIDSTVALRADTHYIGTTSVALNRASANLALTGISSVTLPGSTSGSVQIIPTAVAGTGTIFALPAVTGTAITTGDTGTITNTMLAGSIANAKLANSSVTIGSTGISLGGTATTIAGLTSITSTTFVGALTGNASTASSVVNALTIGSGLSGTSFNGSAAVTIAIDSTVALRADTHYIGTTSVALNRASANLALTGISSVTLPGSTSGSVQIIPTATAGTGTVFTLPAVTGTAITTGDTGTVTNAMLAGSIATTKLSSNYVTIGSTSITLGSSTSTITGLTSIQASTFTGALSGNASSADVWSSGRTISLTGDVTGTSASWTGAINLSLTTTIPPDSITYGKIQNVSTTNRILGRIGLGAGDIEELTAPNIFTILGITASATQLNYVGSATGTTGTTSTNIVFSTSPTLVTPNIGTPSAGTLTNCSGLPLSGVSGLGTGIATFLATPSSVNLLSAVTDETGSGKLVFGTSPTFSSSLGTDTSTIGLFESIATTINIGWTSTVVNINSTIASNSTTTGALVVDGGVGIAGALNINGNIGIIGGNLALSNTTSNYISFSNYGTALPTYGSISDGTKINLWNGASSYELDYSIGLAGGNFWFSIPSNTNYNWYASDGITTNISTLLSLSRTSVDFVIPDRTLNSVGALKLSAWTGSSQSGPRAIAVDYTLANSKMTADRNHYSMVFDYINEETGYIGYPKIINATWSSNTATFITQYAHGFSAGKVINISGITPSGYNGTYVISSISTSSITVNLLTDPGTYTSGGIINIGITNIVWSSPNATITSASHGLIDGQTVDISGVTPTGFNSTLLTVANATTDTFTVAISNPGSVYTSGGIIQVKHGYKPSIQGLYRVFNGDVNNGSGIADLIYGFSSHITNRAGVVGRRDINSAIALRAYITNSYGGSITSPHGVYSSLLNNNGVMTTPNGIYNEVINYDGSTFGSAYGLYNYVYSTGSASVVSTLLRGIHNQVFASVGAVVPLIEGLYNNIYTGGAAPNAGISLVRGVYNDIFAGNTNYPGQYITTAYAIHNKIQCGPNYNQAPTLGTAYGVYNEFSRTYGTFTTAYGLYQTFTGTIGTKVGIYSSGETYSALSGALSIGSTAAPINSGKLEVNSGNITVSVAGATSGNSYLRLIPTDYAVGKPELRIYKTTTATKWQIGLTDGSTNDGVIQLDSAATSFTGSLNVTKSGTDTYYDVAEYNGAVSVTGIIKINLPSTWTASMFVFEIDLYHYLAATPGGCKIYIGAYSASAGSWSRSTVNILGHFVTTNIRLGYDSVLSRPCILIGDTTTVWAYPKLRVSKVLIGHTTHAGFETGWTTEVITSEANLTSLITPDFNAGRTTDTYVSASGDKICLYGTINATNAYTLGIENITMYFRSNGYFRWYIGGLADVGVTSYMNLSTSGLNLRTGLSYSINGVSILNSTTLGSSVLASSLTSVGTITTGIWNAGSVTSSSSVTATTTLSVANILVKPGVNTTEIPRIDDLGSAAFMDVEQIRRLTGDDTYWDDLTFQMTPSVLGALTKPDYDTTEVGLLFPQNLTTEIVYLNVQFPHRWKQGSTIYPHIHWHQASSSTPVFKIDYRWVEPGAAVGSWTTGYIMSTKVYTYTSGTIGQISDNATGISGTGKTISSILQVKLYRDDNAYTGDVLVTSFDIHIEIDGFGSESQFTKE